MSHSHVRHSRKVLMGALGILVASLAAGCDSNGSPTATTTATNPAPVEIANQSGSAQTTPAPTTAAQAPAVQASTTAPNQFAASQTAPQPGTAPAAEAPPATPPPVRFEPPTMELGILKPGESKTGTVMIHNLGNQPLTIAGSKSSCKCTAIDLANIVIEPGQSTPLTASMKPDSGTGPKKAKVMVAFQGYGPVASVDINAEVAQAVKADPAYLACAPNDAGVMPPLFGTIKVTSLGGETFKILASNRAAPDYVDFNPETDSPRNEYTIRWDVTQYSPDNCDEWPGWWVIETDHPEAPVVDVRIRHKCTVPKQLGSRRWIPQGQRQLLGLLEPGEASEFTVSMLWAKSALNHDDHVIVAVPRSSEFTVELLSTDYTLEEPEFKLRVTPAPEHRGLLYGVIELHSIQGHMAEFVIMGRVVEKTESAN